MFSKPLITYNRDIVKINENEQKKVQREQRQQNTENRLTIEMTSVS